MATNNINNTSKDKKIKEVKKELLFSHQQYDFPSIHLLNAQKNYLRKIVWGLKISICICMLILLLALGYALVQDEFEWAILIDGTDFTCIK